MTVFLVRRFLQSLLVVFVMSIVVFVGVYAIGDPVDIYAQAGATQQEVEETKRSLGLDRPLWEQYAVFVRNAIGGELGNSFIFNEPALTVIIRRFPATLELAVSAMALAFIIGLPLGLVAGLRQDSIVDRLVMAGSIVQISLPSFWVGLMLVMLFAVEFGVLPATGRGDTVLVLGVPVSLLTWDGLKHVAMPALNLALFPMAFVIRLTRAGVIEHLQLDYVKFARAKGLSNRRIIFVHVLKNIMIPVVTVTGLQFGVLIAFAVVTESVFAWPGMGKLIIDSIGLLDRPVIVAYLMFTAVIFVVINLVVDIVYSLLDPRVRIAEAKD